ncbi:MAG: flagellar protein export ATPase FliI [Pseudomonadota bacterium]|nr:flagellar protein export ATPase FliI [Pseudomonadota bacterium]
MPNAANKLIRAIDAIPTCRLFGRVTAVLGMLVEVGGVERRLSVGSRCHIIAQTGIRVPCEVVGFRGGRALLMPFAALEGVGLGCRAEVGEPQPAIFPTEAWLGRVINAFGEPIDGKGPLPKGPLAMALRSKPPPAQNRQRVAGKIDLGVRAINTFTTICRGQRMGIFSGSGVGKSILMSMMARFTKADISVIGLVGERGREVQEFLEDDLGAEGLERSVVIVATSDETPLMRRQAAYTTLAVSEYFRDSGRQVLCLMDSVTRFAMAQREIGLSTGEPPTSKGYPPTTFSELARLLERAGPGIHGTGAITGLFSVLVEGDDHNEPISDAVRGIIDGHIVLQRSIADRGRYPAIDVLKSISRSMPGCNDAEQNKLISDARALTARYEDMAELIRLGAYRKGTDPEVDRAIRIWPQLEDFLRQDRNERTMLEHGYDALGRIMSGDDPHVSQGEK